MSQNNNKTTDNRLGSTFGNKSLPFYIIIIAIVVILTINYIATFKPIDKIVLLEDETTKIATTTTNPFESNEDDEAKGRSLNTTAEKVIYKIKDIFGLAPCVDFDQTNEFNVVKNKMLCYENKELPKIDTETFESIDHEYFKDKNGVYKILRPDPTSYKQPYLTTSLDPHTVKVLTPAIIKDKNGVYRRDNEVSAPILMTEADTDTFDIFSPCSGTGNSVSYYYADKNRIYTENGTANYIDNATFQYFGYYNDHSKNPTSLSYAKDKDQVYVGCGRVLKEADPVTFMDLKRGYSRDSERIWYLGNPINQGDITSFTILDGGYSKDKNNVYYNDNIMIGADPQSFTVVKTDLNPNLDFYVLDKNNIYHNGAVFNASTTKPTSR